MYMYIYIYTKNMVIPVLFTMPHWIIIVVAAQALLQNAADGCPAGRQCGSRRDVSES